MCHIYVQDGGRYVHIGIYTYMLYRTAEDKMSSGNFSEVPQRRRSLPALDLNNNDNSNTTSSSNSTATTSNNDNNKNTTTTTNNNNNNSKKRKRNCNEMNSSSNNPCAMHLV